MKGRELLAQRFDAGLIALVLQDGRIEDIAVDRDDLPRAGAIHLAKVARLAPAMRAAFVELGDGTTGLLRASEIRPKIPPNQEIGAVLRTGETVLVQVKAVMPKDKAPLVSMEVTFPGRFLVHAPLGKGVSLSRRVIDPSERARLAAMGGLEEGGWIVRARAASADPSQIAQEAAALAGKWAELSARAPADSAPVKLAEGPSAAVRLLTESAETPGRIELSDRSARQDVEAWAADFGGDIQPELSGSSAADLFSFRDLNERLAELLRPTVSLSGGGAIVIEPTAALTAVDVDSGARCTPLQANLEAAQEIARQIRLRHVGGIVVVDFITMRRDQDRKKVLAALGKAVSNDPVPTHLYGVSALGLVELARERRGLPLSQLIAPGVNSSQDQGWPRIP